MNINLYNECLKKGMIPLDNIINRKSQINFRCTNCGKISNLLVRSVLVKTKYGCRSCAYKSNTEEFISKMKVINPNISIIGSYINNKTKIKCKCNIDGYEWEQRPNDLQQEIGCPKCSGYIHHTTESFLSLLRQNSKNNITLLSDFVNHRTPILCECNICKYRWEIRPYDILHNTNECQKCSGRYSPTTIEFKEKLKMINSNINVIGEYIDSKTSIKCECNICGCIFYPTPSNLTNGKTGCPDCNGQKSKMEALLKSFFDDNKIEYKIHMKFEDLKGVGNKPLSYDFYLPTFNKLIECQGLQHYKPVKYFGGEESFKIQKEHDERKRKYALNKNIDLIEISYKYKNEIIDYIKKALNLHKLSA